MLKWKLGSNEAIKQAIVGGLGVSVLSRYVLALEGINGPLRILDVEGFPIPLRWYILYPGSKQLSIVAQTFLEYLLDEGPRIADQA